MVRYPSEYALALTATREKSHIRRSVTSRANACLYRIRGPCSSGAEPTDTDLVERAKRAVRDDYGAFEVLVQRYQEKVLGNCRYLTGSRDDADDLAQEVFVKAFFALPRFEGRSTFHTWLWRIKVNHCLNHLRRSRQERTIDVETPGLSFGLGTRDITRNLIAGFYARKIFSTGKELEIRGQRGVLRSIAPTQTLFIQPDETVIAVSNAAFLEDVVKQ